MRIPQDTVLTRRYQYSLSFEYSFEPDADIWYFLSIKQDNAEDMAQVRLRLERMMGSKLPIFRNISVWEREVEITEWRRCESSWAL